MRSSCLSRINGKQKWVPTLPRNRDSAVHHLDCSMCMDTIWIQLVHQHASPEYRHLIVATFMDFFCCKVSVSNSLQNIMILGDFCADGLYVTQKQMKELRIRSDKNFHWLIGDDMDTTSDTSKDHTYDRQGHISSIRPVDPSTTQWFILSFCISLAELSCTEMKCWRLSCRSQPSRSISTRSFTWPKKWWGVRHKQGSHANPPR